MSPQEAIADVCRRLYERHLVTSVAGNVSTRDGELVYITRTGSAFGRIDARDVVSTDMAGTVVGGGKPSSELPMHLEIYRANPTIRAIVHTHSPVATAFAVAGEGLPVITTEAEMLLGEVPLVPYAAPGSVELGRAVASFCSSYRAALLERHGVVSWGPDLQTAFQQAELTEETARVCLVVRLLRGGKGFGVPLGAVMP
jgi:L-fuculose-phosphate aldolase